MPRVRQYKITREKCGGYIVDEWMAVDKEVFDAFLASDRVTLEAGWRDDPDYYEWTPAFPMGRIISATTIPEDALYQSNMRSLEKAFEDEGIECVVVDGNGTVRIDTGHADTTRSLALAAATDKNLDGYPVFDEEDMSNLEMELTEEAFKDYGRDDAIKALAHHGSSLVDEDGDIREEYREHAEPYLYRLADNAVSYSGELYFGYSSKWGESWDGFKYAIEEVAEVYGEHPRPGIPEMVERFDRMVRADKLQADREEYEKHQSPISGIEEV